MRPENSNKRSERTCFQRERSGTVIVSGAKAPQESCPAGLLAIAAVGGGADQSPSANRMEDSVKLTDTQRRAAALRNRTTALLNGRQICPAERPARLVAAPRRGMRREIQSRGSLRCGRRDGGQVRHPRITNARKTKLRAIRVDDEANAQPRRRIAERNRPPMGRRKSASPLRHPDTPRAVEAASRAPVPSRPRDWQCGVATGATIATS